MGNYRDAAQRQPFIELVHEDTGTVVTIIEVLSPSNKIAPVDLDGCGLPGSAHVVSLRVV